MQQYLTGEALVFSAKNDSCSEFEFNLPEYLPGISRIAKTNVCIEKTFVHTGSSAVFLDLFLKISIIYISDFEGKIKTASFREKVTLEFTGSFDDDEKNVIIPSAFISSASSKPSSTRKVQTTVCYHGSVEVVKEAENLLFDCEETQNIYMQKDELSVCSRTTIGEVFFEHQTEITLDESKPSIGEMVYADAVFCSSTCNFKDGGIDFEGKFMLHAMYEGESDDDNSSATYTVITAPITVSESISHEKITADSKGYIYLDILSAEPSVSFDSIGENKVISLSVRYSACPVIFNEQKIHIVTDAFSEQYQSTPRFSDIRANVLKCMVNDSVHVADSIKADLRDVAEICDCMTKIMSVSAEYAEGKLFVRAKCKSEIYGATSHGELTSFEAVSTLHIPVPCSCVLDGNCEPDIIISVRSCTAKIQEGEIVCDFNIDVNGVVLCAKNINAVTKLDVDHGNPVTRKKGEIIICYPAKNETLWHLAKKYTTNPETLLKANSLESDDISDRRTLLIP